MKIQKCRSRVANPGRGRQPVRHNLSVGPRRSRPRAIDPWAPSPAPVSYAGRAHRYEILPGIHTRSPQIVPAGHAAGRQRPLPRNGIEGDIALDPRGDRPGRRTAASAAVAGAAPSRGGGRPPASARTGPSPIPSAPESGPITGSVRRRRGTCLVRILPTHTPAGAKCHPVVRGLPPTARSASTPLPQPTASIVRADIQQTGTLRPRDPELDSAALPLRAWRRGVAPLAPSNTKAADPAILPSERRLSGFRVPTYA